MYLESYFPRATMEQLAKRNNVSVILHTYNKTGIPQLWVCSGRVKHGNKQKACRLFIVPGNGHYLLGI